MNVFEAVMHRRSVRKYIKKEVAKEDIFKLIDAAHWAPSGKNGQPWKFVIIENRNRINDISGLSIYKSWIKESSCLIAVYLDKQQSYDYKKDLQAIGAAIQNMILTAHDIGLGCCWVGEILKNEETINKNLEIDAELELMAVVTVGYPDKSRINVVKRKNVDECIAKWL